MQTLPAPILIHTDSPFNRRPGFRPSSSQVPITRQNPSAPSVAVAGSPVIYAVDDVLPLTALYTILLESAGYIVRAFNHRTEALAALRVDQHKPQLLITDYLGPTLPVDLFMHDCRAIHPGLRILLASGFNQSDLRFTRVRPDRFIRKPFTFDEFHREVQAALAGAL